jgi:serine phosphatase RsbU (regulator of sigma subunit)
LPLGGLTKDQYRQQELTLSADDKVVLMSDGLPERFNAQGEMLEFARSHQALSAVAHTSTEEIIAALIRLGEE